MANLRCIIILADYNPMELASHNQQGFFSSAESVLTSTSTLFVLMSLLMAFWGKELKTEVWKH